MTTTDPATRTCPICHGSGRQWTPRPANPAQTHILVTDTRGGTPLAAWICDDEQATITHNDDGGPHLTVEAAR